MNHQGKENPHRRPGPNLDRSVRILVEDDPNAFCDWLGEPRDHDVEILSSSFAAETRYADFVGRVGPDRLLHVEYIKKPDRETAVKMVTYLAQLMRSHPGASISQYALVQGTGQLPSVDDPRTGFALGLTTVYLRERDATELLTKPNTGALAVLARGGNEDRARYLETALHQMRDLPENRHKRLLYAVIELAAINLDSSTIETILEKETGMTIDLAEFYRDTKFGRRIHQEGLTEGLEQGSTRILTALLRDRFGDDAWIPEIAAHLARGTDDSTAIHLINEATTLDDLSGWLVPTQPAEVTPPAEAPSEC